MKPYNITAAILLLLSGCTNSFQVILTTTPEEELHTLVTNSSGELSSLPKEYTKPNLKTLELDEERLIVFKGIVNNSSSEAFINQLVDLEKTDSTKPINIVIRSGGGDIPAGFRMIAAMEATKPQLICIVDEGAYSMAAAIFLHCDKKYIQEHADLMFHEGSLGVEGGKQIVKQRVQHYLKQMDALNKDIAEQLNIPLEEYLEKVDHEWWLTAEDAVEAGVADQIIEGLKYSFEEPPAPSPFLFFIE